LPPFGSQFMPRGDRDQKSCSIRLGRDEAQAGCCVEAVPRQSCAFADKGGLTMRIEVVELQAERSKDLLDAASDKTVQQQATISELARTAAPMSILVPV
jgi:hypothetical protein